MLYASGSMTDLILDELSPDAPKLLSVIPGVAVCEETGCAHGTQVTDLLAGVVEEGCVRAGKHEVVERADNRNVGVESGSYRTWGESA